MLAEVIVNRITLLRGLARILHRVRRRRYGPATLIATF